MTVAHVTPRLQGLRYWRIEAGSGSVADLAQEPLAEQHGDACHTHVERWLAQSCEPAPADSSPIAV